MFAKPIQTADPRLLLKIVTGDVELGRRLKAALEPAGRFHIELLLGRLGDMAAKFEPVARASLLIVEIDQQSTDDLAALESVLRGAQLPPATVVVSDGLAASAARRLLKLQIADWLPKSCSDREVLLACEQALKPADSGTSQHARCTTFVSALGGAGATTLSMAAASVLAGKARAGLAGCCIVDLNFQSGAACDYLDVGPTLQLSEI